MLASNLSSIEVKVILIVALYCSTLITAVSNLFREAQRIKKKPSEKSTRPFIYLLLVLGTAATTVDITYNVEQSVAQNTKRVAEAAELKSTENKLRQQTQSLSAQIPIIETNRALVMSVLSAAHKLTSALSAISLDPPPAVGGSTLRLLRALNQETLASLNARSDPLLAFKPVSIISDTRPQAMLARFRELKGVTSPTGNYSLALNPILLSLTPHYGGGDEHVDRYYHTMFSVIDGRQTNAVLSIEWNPADPSRDLQTLHRQHLIALVASFTNANRLGKINQYESFAFPEEEKRLLNGNRSIASGYEYFFSGEGRQESARVLCAIVEATNRLYYLDCIIPRHVINQSHPILNAVSVSSFDSGAILAEQSAMLAFQGLLLGFFSPKFPD